MSRSLDNSPKVLRMPRDTSAQPTSETQQRPNSIVPSIAATPIVDPGFGPMGSIPNLSPREIVDPGFDPNHHMSKWSLGFPKNGENTLEWRPKTDFDSTVNELFFDKRKQKESPKKEDITYEQMRAAAGNTHFRLVFPIEEGVKIQDAMSRFVLRTWSKADQHALEQVDARNEAGPMFKRLVKETTVLQDNRAREAWGKLTPEQHQKFMEELGDYKKKVTENRKQGIGGVDPAADGGFPKMGETMRRFDGLVANAIKDFCS